MGETFNIAHTNDDLDSEGNLTFSTEWLKSVDGKEHIKWEFSQETQELLSSRDVANIDVLQMGGRIVDSSTLENSERLTLIVRHGVGYDNVDVDACTKAGVILSITPDGVRRPMASACLAFVLALAHQLPQKERLVRRGEMRESSYEKIEIGIGVTGKTLGLIGCGNIGKEVFKLAKPFDMKFITYDPYVKQEEIDALGVKKVDLPTLMSSSDFVCVCTLLNKDTIGLVGKNELKLMKSSAFLINISRGPIVDEDALISVLTNKTIKGAALDVFREEPVDINNPLLKLDNVIATPHTLGGTEELHTECGYSTMRAALAVCKGEFPNFIVNKQIIKDSRVITKLQRYKELYGNL